MVNYEEKVNDTEMCIEEDYEDNSNLYFVQYIDNFFDELHAIGVRCEKDWTCCESCGHEAMYASEEEDYVFYSGDNNIKDGATELYLEWGLNNYEKEGLFMTIVYKYGEIRDDVIFIKLPGIEIE